MNGRGHVDRWAGEATRGSREGIVGPSTSSPSRAAAMVARKGTKADRRASACGSPSGNPMAKGMRQAAEAPCSAAGRLVAAEVSEGRSRRHGRAARPPASPCRRRPRAVAGVLSRASGGRVASRLQRPLVPVPGCPHPPADDTARIRLGMLDGRARLRTPPEPCGPFVYLDGPPLTRQRQVAFDVLDLEDRLRPGCLIVIDGRRKNAQYLSRRLTRDYTMTRMVPWRYVFELRT